MTKKPNKIEDVLEILSPDSTFEPKSAIDLGLESNSVSFPQILDFAFPQGSGQTPVVELGEITYVGDGVVHIVGLAKATIDEVVDINTRQNYVEKALILGVGEDKVEAVVLGDYSTIKRGDQVRSTGKKLTIPTGEKLLSRVINPLGRPLDGKGPVDSTKTRPVEFNAPGVMDRQPITEPLHTGIAVIDATIPIGKGQRELIIGDRKSGKSRTLLDIIGNQKNKNVYCIYVGVGMQSAKAKSALKLLAEKEALAYTCMVMSLADDPPSVQYLAPYAGAAIAEEFMYDGKDVLIIYDDLSKQAKAYRQVSLLLKRSPGRDAYPGDIFFLHSRLLERAALLSKEKKGGSMTALPVAETQSGDVSDYIITNLMSITDGHIYLDSNLMNEGVLPAVNSGTSVSRIGGKVQTEVLQKVGELVSRTLARYEEVKSYETINTEVSEETIRDIKRGKRVKEILSQDSKLNLSDDEEVVLLGLAVSNRMDHFETEQVIVFKKNVIPIYRQNNFKELRERVNQAKALSELESGLNNLFSSVCRTYKLPLIKK